MNYFGEIERKCTLHLWEELERLEKREILCAHGPKVSSVSIGPVSETLRVFSAVCTEP